MKLLVFSDSHQNTAHMKKAIEDHLRVGNIDCIFHLGDGHRDLEMLTHNIPVCYVDGNYEEYAAGYIASKSLKREVTIDLYGFRFFLTHGHIYGVKNSLDAAVREAKNKGADVLIYGHTHEKYYRYIPPESDCDKGFYIFNPGSISRPRDKTFSYGIITIEGKNILFSHASVI